MAKRSEEEKEMLKKEKEEIKKVLKKKKADEKERKKFKGFLFDMVVIVLPLTIAVYLWLMHPAWVSTHIMTPILNPLFKNLGLIK